MDENALQSENLRLRAELEAAQQTIQSLQRRLNIQPLLIRIGALLNSQRELEPLLDMIVSASAELMLAEGCSLFLIDEAQRELYFHCVKGENEAKLKHLRIPLGVGIVGSVAQTGEPLLISDAQHDPRWYRGVDQETEFVTRSILCVPLKAEKKILGALEIINKKGEGFFGPSDQETFEALAGVAAVAIDNARLTLDLEQLFHSSIRSLVNLIEAADAYTRGHSERVTLYAGLLARELELPAELCQRIETAGMLHDIGKIGVGPEIIRKPGKLTDEEFTIIQRHPEIGYRSIKDIHLLEEILPGVLHHHERWDGRGYPQKIKGEAIPAMARIIAIADTYDAMTSTRAYRPALPVEVALQEIERCAGTQFDPALVPCFIRAIRSAQASGSVPVSG